MAAHEACGGVVSADEFELLEEADAYELILCRLDELKRAGCVSPGCALLAGRVDVNVKAAATLVERGCPPELALRILL